MLLCSFWLVRSFIALLFTLLVRSGFCSEMLLLRLCFYSCRCSDLGSTWVAFHHHSSYSSVGASSALLHGFEIGIGLLACWPASTLTPPSHALSGIEVGNPEMHFGFACWVCSTALPSCSWLLRLRCMTFCYYELNSYACLIFCSTLSGQTNCFLVVLMLTCYSSCFSILSLRSWNSGVITYASAPRLSTSASFPANWAANLTKIGSQSNPFSGMHLHLWSSGTRIFDLFVPRLRLILAGRGSWMSWTGRNCCGCPLSSYSCNWSHLDHTVFLSCPMEVFADDHLLLIWWGA